MAVCKISIHALREEGDPILLHCMETMSDFYPRPPRGGRHFKTGMTSIITVFLSTPSARRATLTSARIAATIETFLSTPSARRATSTPITSSIRCRISIHALREEGDAQNCALTSMFFISIHALREEGDLNVLPPRNWHTRFLSTPSARRATGEHKPITADIFLFLSTPSARRATIRRIQSRRSFQFLSTPSARRATRKRYLGANGGDISIHALREEGDRSWDGDYMFNQ